MVFVVSRFLVAASGVFLRFRRFLVVASGVLCGLTGPNPAQW